MFITFAHLCCIVFSYGDVHYLMMQIIPSESGREMAEREEIERESKQLQEGVFETEEIVEEKKRLQPWTQQITIRGVVSSIIIGSLYSIIAMKLNLTTGITPNLNVSAALLAFVFMRSWTKMLHKFGITTTPFTRQENTMIQTCSVACYSIAVGGWN